MSCQNSSRSCKITFNEKIIKAILGYNLCLKSLLSITEVSSVSLLFEFMFPTNHFYATVCVCLFCTPIYIVQQQSPIGIQPAYLLMHNSIKVRLIVKTNRNWKAQICVFSSLHLPLLFFWWRKRSKSIAACKHRSVTMTGTKRRHLRCPKTK